MEERINRILKHFNLTSTQFADAISVQRSSVSHVMTGRNKPGFDFIQKIIGAFPDISAEWLITGVGSMLKKDVPADNELFVEQKSQPEPRSKFEDAESEEDINKAPGSIDDIHAERSLRKRSINRIIVIYDDKSFDEYLPR